jgi:hypothetical protein
MLPNKKYTRILNLPAKGRKGVLLLIACFITIFIIIIIICEEILD